MNKFFIFFLLIFLNYEYAFCRNIGETEITTEDGIEVFQEEKYYLLNKNVEIDSDELQLKGQIVTVYFEKDLYDIVKLIAKEEVTFSSEEYNIKGKGNYLKFNVKKQIINVKGKESELLLEGTDMLSDNEINVDNLSGNFSIYGPNSKLITESIYITGSKINGTFETIDGKRTVGNIEVVDENKVNIKTDDIIMFSKKAIYNKKKSIIELFEDVEIIRGGEVITGDYGILETEKKSYKVSSNNSKKVKAVIIDSNE